MRIESAAVVLLFVAACSSTKPRYEYAPDMVDSVAYESFTASPVTRDGKTMIAPAPGTIARGAKPFRYDVGPGEAARAGRELANPLERTERTLARGEKVFRVFCTPCHGTRGLGDGPVVPPFSKPPSLLGEKARSLPDGQIFHIIARGQNLMPAHAIQVTPEDRWKVIHFIRSLQD